MDCTKTGVLIRTLRKEKGLTQRQLAQALFVSEQAVSKWECGAGLPDVSLMPELSRILGVQPDKLLTGEMEEKDLLGGNMKQSVFYVCPKCGNILCAAAQAEVYCCGKKLESLPLQKAVEQQKLCVEQVETEYFISGAHEMTKQHHIAFVALLSGDTVVLKKQYPEWDLQVRMPRIPHGKLVWYCTQHGLYYQLI